MSNLFLPTSKAEMNARGWEQLDIIIISGDAYIDHPSFSAAIIGRHLESLGYKVGIIAQPDINSEKDFTALGSPRLFFGVTSGNMDSMVNHYTAQNKIRTDDAYSPDGKAGLRPNRAVMIYTQKIKTYFKKIPVVIGGIEASLRRIPHYDYWSNTVKDSILSDCKADILVYGAGEIPIAEIAQRIEKNESLENIRGTVIISANKPGNACELPAFQTVKDKKGYYEMMKSFFEHYLNKTLFMPHQKRYLVHYPPSQAMTTEQLDKVYDLPYKRLPHPMYKGSKIPAFEQIKESITAHRGCFGGCNFCAIGLHQGKAIQSRSEKSILNEVAIISQQPYFEGIISDIGGPSANMYKLYCKLKIAETCKKESCLYPEICPHLETSQEPYRKLLRKALNQPNVKRVYISSGVRFDLALKDISFSKDLAKYYTGGHLKLAPEHVNDRVLQLMFKPKKRVYDDFCQLFTDISHANGKEQYILPYIIVGHPGSTLETGLELAIYLKNNNIKVRQIQEFTPTPMSISTLMYYTEMDFTTGKKVFVPRGRQIRLQKALAQWFIPENKKYVYEALRELNRLDLLDFFLGEKERKGAV
ncbi:MAG TPA: YgiQ family radical SAM protein [Candidatus Cloacimonadota bacterium]|nr:YgiQ family radical SAM protein [Candidatus Cloacimonadota bacterium]HQB41257.1 YgiQ family radical SAM protein [Candidatus Cloacimonadota bacterium]